MREGFTNTFTIEERKGMLCPECAQKCTQITNYIRDERGAGMKKGWDGIMKEGVTGCMMIRALVWGAMFVWMRGYYAIESDVMFDLFPITETLLIGPPQITWTTYLWVEGICAAVSMIFMGYFVDCFSNRVGAWISAAIGFVLIQFAIPVISLMTISGILGGVAILRAYWDTDGSLDDLMCTWETGMFAGATIWLYWRYGAIMGTISFVCIVLACRGGFYVGMIGGTIRDYYRDRRSR